jgi:enolase
MPVVKSVKSIKVLNSRGDWTIKTYLELNDGETGWSVVPEGASKGEREALCLPAEEAVEIISSRIASALENRDFQSQGDFDKFLIDLDGTENKGKLGGNTLISLSIAFARATNYLKEVAQGRFFSDSTITPLFNILNGGKHARNNLSFQEFMIVPAKKYSIQESLEIGRTIYKSLKARLEKDGFSTGVGDEGGFAPESFNTKKALQYIHDCASEHYKVGEEVFLGMDVAAESFYNREEDKYVIKEEGLELSPTQLKDYHADLLSSYEIIYLEDPFFEEDSASWADFTKGFGSKVMVSADDSVVTNPKILDQAIKDGAANTVIVKPNQVGTLTETLKFIDMAREAKWNVVVSHRSGDTEDPFIADLAYAVSSDFVKFGAIDRAERTSKFNRLLELFNSVE